MGNLPASCEGAALGTGLCGTLTGTYNFFNKTKSASSLAGELRRRLDNPNSNSSSRLIGADPIPYLPESPILKNLTADGTEHRPGKTYVVYSRAENGKSAALQDFVLNHLDGRDGLYLSGIEVSNTVGIVAGLQEILNTSCNGADIVKALVLALGNPPNDKPKRKAFLVIDEVNLLDGPVFEVNAGFITMLFQKIARVKGIVCIVATNNPDTANGLVKLNGGKIKPHRNFLSQDWKITQSPAWKEMDWEKTQLKALLDLKYPDLYDSLGFDFVEDGMTPGDVIADFSDLMEAGM